MRLSPGNYPCPDHATIDLTDAVKAELDFNIPVPGYELTILDTKAPGQPKPVVDKKFWVIVGCPGPAGANEKHDVEFHGQYSDP